MFETFIKSFTNAVMASPLELFATICSAIFFGFLTSLTYIKTQKGKIYSSGFALTLVILAGAIAVIVIMIGSNVARAFSLAGAFQLVRFRAQGAPKDILFILVTMSAGLCCGMGYIAYSAMITLIFCAVIFVLEKIKYGQQKTERMLLKITVPEDLNFRDAFTSVLDQYTSYCKRKYIKSINLGSLFELHYSLELKNCADEKAFLDDLRIRNGNLSIILTLDATTDADSQPMR